MTAAQRRMEPHLLACFAGSRLSDDERDELVFHLSEILADLVEMQSLVFDQGKPKPSEVRRFLDAVVWHWPFHIKGAAALHEKL